jgi:hypothetical protein
MKGIQRIKMLDISATHVVGRLKYLETISMLTTTICPQRRIPARTMMMSLSRFQVIRKIR